MTETTITRQLVPESKRLSITAELFGVNFPLLLEPAVFNFAGQLAHAYHGAYWHFYRLGNGGFYMAPDTEARFRVVCENCYEGALSADALGITACLYAYSHLAFTAPTAIALILAEHYHWLREFMFEHPEARQILQAID
ncbi:MAG: Antirestriction protein KlcA [Pseudomonadales bacterium]|nr:Antirestriction protein KlcA [Pseudomonadales bacterium]